MTLTLIIVFSSSRSYGSSRAARCVWIALGSGLIGNPRDGMRLLERTARRTIGDIRARELERPPAIVAAAGVELSGMIREGEQMPLKKLIEAKTRDVELSLGLFELALRNQHIGKAPIDFRITARKRWQEQRFRVAGAALARADLRLVHKCLWIAG